MEFKNYTTELNLDCCVDEKIKMKEVHYLNEATTELQEVQQREFVSVKDVEKRGEKYRVTKIEIKQEPFHLSEPSNNIKSEPKQPLISNEVSYMDPGVMKIDTKQEPLHLNESEQEQPVPLNVEVLPLKGIKLDSVSVCSSSTRVDFEKNSFESNDNEASETKVEGSGLLQRCKTYTCDICCKSFSLLSELKEHSVNHMEKSTFKCLMCAKSFTRLVSLKHHILIVHEGKRPYSCDICGQSFTQASHLKNHKLRHEGKRPHVCGTCDKSFTTKSQLKRHESVHDDNRPYTCDICNKAFTIPYKLKRHQSTHDGKRLRHLLE